MTIDMKSPSSMCQPQGQHRKPNPDVGSTSTWQAHHQHGKLNVNTASSTLTQRAHHWQGQLNIDAAISSSTRPAQS